MSVHIDGIIFSLQSQGGISVYFQQLLRVLCQAGVPTRLGLEVPLLQVTEAQNSAFSVTRRAARYLERYRRCRSVPEATIFHSSYYRQPEQCNLPTVVTVHDFVYEHCYTGAKRWVHTTQKHAAIRAAQAIICVSEATRRDLLHFVGVRPDQSLHVIMNGVSECFRPLTRQQYVADRPFVLFVGDRSHYKNFNLLLKAMALLSDLALYCVGGGPLKPSELAWLPAHVQCRIRHLGFISDERLNCCYNQAVCLVYPSGYEGFGIPVAEAMRAGCPVVSTPCAAVSEVGGAALTVAEAAPVALAQAISQCLEPDYRRTVREKGLCIAQRYSWTQTHRQTLSLYHQLGVSMPYTSACVRNHRLCG